MTKLQLSALSLLITAAAGLTLFNLSSNDSNQQGKILTTEQDHSEVSTLRAEKPPVNMVSVERSELPVAHGIADENGQQIHANDQPRRLPPPISAPDNRNNKLKSNTASQHGHEINHLTEQQSENTPPPPRGANK